MATSISNFDLFSIVENLIQESSDENPNSNVDPTASISDQKDASKLADDFTNATKKANLDNKSKKKKQVKQNKKETKKEEEDSDVIDKDEDDKEEIETPDESPSTLKLGDALDYKKFVDDLNKFRAAHSFDDPEISEELKDFFDKLEDDEKKAFYVILKGLIQVTLMGVEGKTARTPSELKFSIKKTGSVSSEKRRSMKRKIDISKELNDKGVKDKKVDTSTPIKIGESYQNKTDIYKIIRENK